MYIIWKYDKFPYKLCDKVIGKPDKEGYYQTESYGTMRFLPLRIITNDAKGKIVKERLQAETVAKRIEQDHLDKRFNDIVAATLLNILGL